MIESHALRLKQKVDKLSVRERIIVTVLVLLAIYLLWDVLILYWQNTAIKNKSQQTAQQTQQLEMISKESNRITVAAQDPSKLLLLERYKHLQKKIAELEYGMQNYKQQVISSKDIHRVIYQVLNDIKKVKLLSFKSIVENSEDGAVTKAVSKLPGFSVNMKEYELIFSGQYFAVLNYLQQLEKQGWQFYWEVFEYKVDKYPVATVTVRFHTLVKNDV